MRALVELVDGQRNAVGFDRRAWLPQLALVDSSRRHCRNNRGEAEVLEDLPRHRSFVDGRELRSDTVAHLVVELVRGSRWEQAQARETFRRALETVAAG